ncbi:hypothetical protein GOB10_11055 [Sinorhizobium meliloti]|uniref:hypothetical protein n=1 Tax=Rhizobium meliloti TaxID=382 RepID=UPI000FDB53F3|nr:hypothetical protein [Sinorhizobium meliloti]MDW9896310.1 hypothetical protein [Sinorhizobium meliloti]RVQ54218.1 hypothetical protein CN245_20035 [Sinorhizobium meliloti]
MRAQDELVDNSSEKVAETLKDVPHEKLVDLVVQLVRAKQQLEEKVEQLELEVFSLEEELEQSEAAEETLRNVRAEIVKGDTEYAIELIGREIGY